jgi:hypothetical protein
LLRKTNFSFVRWQNAQRARLGAKAAGHVEIESRMHMSFIDQPKFPILSFIPRVGNPESWS